MRQQRQSPRKLTGPDAAPAVKALIDTHSDVVNELVNQLTTRGKRKHYRHVLPVFRLRLN